jgi:hypothetical protein
MSSDHVSQILEVLQRTKETNTTEDLCGLDHEYLASLGLDLGQPSLTIDRTTRMNLAVQAVNLGALVASVVGEMTWKDFEVFVARILTENSYQCVESYRRRGNSEIKGMEIDVVGVRGNRIVAVDAKLWGVRGGKKTALQTAAEKQRERSRRLANDLSILAEKIPSLGAQDYRIYSVLVTWLVEEVELHNGVPVVPVFKLNSFIVDMDQYDDLMVAYRGSL